MRATARGAPLDSNSLAGQTDVIINAVDSYHVRLAVTGTSCDKYPGKPRLRSEPGEIPQGLPSDSVECPLAELPSDRWSPTGDHADAELT